MQSTYLCDLFTIQQSCSTRSSSYFTFSCHSPLHVSISSSPIDLYTTPSSLWNYLPSEFRKFPDSPPRLPLLSATTSSSISRLSPLRLYNKNQSLISSRIHTKIHPVRSILILSVFQCLTSKRNYAIPQQLLCPSAWSSVSLCLVLW